MPPLRAMKPSPLSNVAWLVGERIVRIGLTATVFTLVARHLAPADFAQLNLALSVVALGATVAQLGLEGVVVHELVRRPAEAGRILGTALALRAAAALAAVLLVVGAGASLPDWRPALPCLALAGAALLFSPAEVVDLLFQRHLQSRRTAVARSGAVFAGAAGRIALVAAGAPVEAFAAMVLAEAALFAALLAAAVRRSALAPGAWCWDPELARQLVRRGAPLAASGLVVALALRLDQFLVVSLAGEEQAGAYFLAARLTEFALLAGTALTLSTFPRVAEGAASGSAALGDRMQALFDALSAFGWLVALGAATGPWLLPLVFGDAYRGAGVVLAVQGWGALLALNAAARWQYILVAAPTGLNLACALFAVAAQLALTPWLLARFGIAGAAVGWTLGVALSGWATSFVFRALRPIAEAQSRALLIPFAPGRWRALVALFLR
jgi:polysaccharide transporter, PST family